MLALLMLFMSSALQRLLSIKLVLTGKAVEGRSSRDSLRCLTCRLAAHAQTRQVMRSAPLRLRLQFRLLRLLRLFGALRALTLCKLFGLRERLIWSQTCHRCAMPLGTLPQGIANNVELLLQARRRLDPDAASCSPKSHSETSIASSDPVAQWIWHRPADPGVAGSSPAGVIDFACRGAHPERKHKAIRVTTVGFEPMPARTGTLSQRLRSNGQAAVMADPSGKKDHEQKRRWARTRQSVANANESRGV